MNQFLVFLFSLIALIEYSNACMCLPAHPQTSFCRSDFAMKIQVLSKRKYQIAMHYEMLAEMGMDPREPYYDIEIKQIFKGHRSKILSNVTITANKLIRSKVFISGKGSSCSVHLATNVDYLITGRFFDGKLHVQSCGGLTKKWNNITQGVKDGLLGDFDCDCPIATCIEGFCDQLSECKWEASWEVPLDETKMKHRVCRTVNKKCQWIGNEHPYQITIP